MTTDRAAPPSASGSAGRRLGVRSRRARVAVLGLSFLPATFAYLAPTATAADDATTATVTREAYYTSPINEAFPPSVVNEVPPGVVCLVAGIAGLPQACGDEVTALKQQLEGTPADVSGGLPLPESPDDQLPQPVAPNSLPVGMLGGKERYASYLRLQLPPIPPGHLVDRFDLVLHEQPQALNVALESPAFREAVLAALVTYTDRNEGGLETFLRKLIAQQAPVVNPAPTGIEACVVTEEWQAGESKDGTDQPSRDCIFGSTGVYDPEAGTWTFNLAFAVQAWLDGTYPNHGISLRPLGAENLAYGDPDLSTNFIISLADSGAEQALLPKFVLRTSPAPEPIDLPSFDPPVAAGPVPSVSAFVPPVPSAPSVVSSPSVGPAAPTGDAPAAPAVRPFEQAGSSEPETPWYIWLVFPVGAAMALGFGGALTSTPAVATTRPGALSALMATRRPGGS